MPGHCLAFATASTRLQAERYEVKQGLLQGVVQGDVLGLPLLMRLL